MYLYLVILDVKKLMIIRLRNISGWSLSLGNSLAMLESFNQVAYWSETASLEILWMHLVLKMVELVWIGRSGWLYCE